MIRYILFFLFGKNDLEKNYSDAINYFNTKYKYTKYSNVLDYLDNEVYIKYQNDNEIQKINKQNDISGEIKRMMTIVYLKVLDEKNSININVDFDIKNKVNSMAHIPIITKDDNFEKMELNKNYKLAQNYFNTTYGNGSGNYINDLKKRYNGVKTNSMEMELINLMAFDIESKKQSGNNNEYFRNTYGSNAEHKIDLLKKK